MWRKFLFLGVATFLSAQTIGEFLEKVKDTPDYKLEAVAEKEFKAGKERAEGSLYPKITLFASGEHYSDPASMKPFLPTDASKIAMEGGGYPFSKNIGKIGVELQMPLFIKSIYETKKQMKLLMESSRWKKKVALLEREAMVVGEIAQYNYLHALQRALASKARSIETTKRAVAIGVRNGRLPKFKLMRLEDSLHQIQLQQEEIARKIAQSEDKIYQLTETNISSPLSFTSNPAPIRQRKGGLPFPVKPLKYQIEAGRAGVAKEKSKAYPKVVLDAKGYRAFGKAYDNGESLALNFGQIGLYLQWDLLDRSRRGDLEKAKVDLLKARLNYAKTLKNLKSQRERLWKELNIVEKEIIHARNSLRLKLQLLRSAKVAFKLNRMSVEDYLKYEDDVAQQRADLAKYQAVRQGILANLALLAGVDLKEVFK